MNSDFSYEKLIDLTPQTTEIVNLATRICALPLYDISNDELQQNDIKSIYRDDKICVMIKNSNGDIFINLKPFDDNGSDCVFHYVARANGLRMFEPGDWQGYVNSVLLSLALYEKNSLKKRMNEV